MRNRPVPKQHPDNEMYELLLIMPQDSPVHSQPMRESIWLACLAVLPSCMTSYVVSVRQARGLPVVSLFPHPASFRFHLAVDTLAFGYTLPAIGRVRDFHPSETCAAGRTKRKPALSWAPVFLSVQE